MAINKDGKTGLTETNAEERMPSLLYYLSMRVHAHTVAYMPIAYAYMLCTTSDEN